MSDSDEMTEMMLDGSQMALSALIAGTAGFLKQRRIAPSDWIAYVGGMFEGAWEGLADEGADVVMQQLLNLSILPMGSRVLREDMSSDRAEVEITPLPSEEVLARFGTEPADLYEGFEITADDFATIYDFQRAALEAIGLTYTHGPGAEGYVLTLSR